jgi:processive 1,2-diacylglycerol beta-glucosyltransferase
MKKKKILCLLSDVGGAHESIARVFEHDLGKDFEFNVVDLFRETSRFCSGSIHLYSRVLLSFPRFYNFFYDFNNKKPLWDLIYTLFIGALMKRKTKDLILRYRPDAVLSLFALTTRIAADALAGLHLENEIPLVVFAVDPFTIHLSWVEPRTSLYLVSSRESVHFLTAMGVREETIKPVRYPIGVGFGGPFDKDELREKHGIGGSKKTVLVMGGGEGVIPIDAIAGDLLEKDGEAHVIAVAGRNEELFARLKDLSRRWNGRMTAYGYSDCIHELMAVSEAVVTKPGPATIMEAVECGLPIIMTGFITRQEEGNVDFVESNGLGVYINREAGLRASEYISDNGWLEGVRGSMKRLKCALPAETAPDEIRRILGRKDET